MNRRPILKKVHLEDPSNPDGNLSILVSVHVTFDKAGQEVFRCQNCASDRCRHCEAAFDQLVSEGTIHA